MQKRAVLRADGSSHLGMGHIMRCLAFASALGEAGVTPVFVTRGLGTDVSGLVRVNGFQVEEIPPGISYQEDAELTREIAAKHEAKFIVIDLSHRETQAKPEILRDYHQFLGSYYLLVSLAGDADVDVPADIVVAPYVGSTDATLTASPGRVLLLGPSYFIFRPEFIAAARASRTINEEARRILVAVGGSDELHLTSKILEAICSLQLTNLGLTNLDLKVAMGVGYTKELWQEVRGILAGFKGEYKLLEHNSNLAEAMLWADLAVTGDGLIKYETAVTGTPSIMVSRPDRKVPFNQRFIQKGSALYIGYDCPLETAVIAKHVERVMGDVGLRNEMSERGKALMDGEGVHRIIARISQEVFQ